MLAIMAGLFPENELWQNVMPLQTIVFGSAQAVIKVML